MRAYVEVDEVTIRPCLCGAIPDLGWYGGGGLEVHCPACGLSAGHHAGLQEAVDAWNGCLSPFFDLLPEDDDGNVIRAGDRIRLYGGQPREAIAVGRRIVVTNEDGLLYSGTDDIEMVG